MGAGTPKRGSAKAASELIRTSPASRVLNWVECDGGLEGHVTIRAKKYPVAVQLQVQNFPKLYSLTPSRGTIEAGKTLRVTVRYRFAPPKTNTDKKLSRRSVCSTAFWTDIRLLVQRMIPGEEICESEAALFEYEDDHEMKTERENVRGRHRKGRDSAKAPNGVNGSPTTFCKTLEMQPLAPKEELCCICYEPMDVKKHVSGKREEKLYALACGHVYHSECIRECATSSLATCPCGCEQYVIMTCALCRRPMTSGEYRKLTGRRRIGNSDFFLGEEDVSTERSESSEASE